MLQGNAKENISTNTGVICFHSVEFVTMPFLMVMKGNIILQTSVRSENKELKFAW